MIKIVVDSTCDFTLEEAEKLGIKIVSLNTNINGKDYKDRIELTSRDFYKLLEKTEEFPKTSQPSPAEFLEAYEDGTSEEDYVIVVTISSSLSGTCQSAILAKQMSEYEDHIYVVDSLTGTHAAKLIALKALELIKEGKDFNSICEYLEEYKTRVRLYAVVDTLDYFLMGGRINKNSAMVGNLLKLKPILTVKDGKLDVIDKKRGMKKSIASIIEFMKEEEIDMNEPLMVAYTGYDTEYEDIEKAVLEAFDFTEVRHGDVGPVIGSHAGPGAKLVAYVVKKS